MEGFIDAGVVDGVCYAYMVGAVSPDGEETLTGPVEILADLGTGSLWLAPPAPNPFGRLSTIEFSVPRGSETRLSIYSPGGRLVRRLLSGGAEGSGAAVWDGLSDEGVRVAPGVYLVRLEVGAESAHRKVVFLK